MSATQTAPADRRAAAPEAPFRLIYRSRSLAPAADQDRGLGDILRVARTNNARLGVTGALLVYDNWFAQTLEGPEATVRALFERIRRDPRHDTVEVRGEGLVAERVFARWAMARVAEHGEPDIALMATPSGVSPGAARKSSSDQERILDMMRDATRGYGRGS